MLKALDLLFLRLVYHKHGHSLTKKKTISNAERILLNNFFKWFFFISICQA